MGLGRLRDGRDERIRVRKRGASGFHGSGLTSGATAGMVTAAIVSAGAWKWTISQRCEVHLPNFFKWRWEEIGDFQTVA